MDTLPTPGLAAPGLAATAFDVVAIGASAGGVEALCCLLSGLAPEFPLPIVVVMHIPPHPPSRLHRIVGGCSRLSVGQAREGQPLRPGTVYTAAPGRHLIVTPQRTLSLTDGPSVHHSRPALDTLFHSVAAACGGRSLGVVLTGANRDGADGIGAIRRAGGTTIAQDRASSQWFRMPGAAIDSGGIGFVLPLERIAPALIALAMVPGASAFFSLPASARPPSWPDHPPAA